MHEVFVKEISKGFLQIYGAVTGIAFGTMRQNRLAYQYDISFTVNGKMFKVSSNEADRTMSTPEAVKSRIESIYRKEVMA